MAPPKLLRVLVDLTRLTSGGEGGGIKPALKEILRWLGLQRNSAIEFIYVSSPEADKEIASWLRPGDGLVSVLNIPADIAARERCDLVYCPFGTTDFACPGVPTIVLVVDLLHRDFPATLPEPDRVFREQQMQSAMAVADFFHVISDFTADRLQSCYAVPAAKIVRTYLPLHARLNIDEMTTNHSFQLEKPYFFYPANTWVHKNHERLLEAYANYRSEAGATSWPLVLSGHIHEARGVTLRSLTNSLGIDDQVVWAGYVGEAALASIYANAGALVFPSLYEGFGLPLLEAMAAGIPVLASNAACIPEIVGDAALLIDANDHAELTAGLLAITRDRDLRDRLTEAGCARIKVFDKDSEFGRLHQAFISVAARPARWRQSGYYPGDGLTDPISTFALPDVQGELHLSLDLKPLPVSRTLNLECGATHLLEIHLPPNESKRIAHTFVPSSRLLTVRVPDAASLSSSDPRIHGVLLESLCVTTVDGTRYDLLTAHPNEPIQPIHPLASGVAGGSHIRMDPSQAPISRDQQAHPTSIVPPQIQYHVDHPVSSISKTGCVTVRGWCFATEDRIDTVRIRVSSLTFFGEFGLPRHDVQTAFPHAPGSNIGFEIRVLLSPGTHNLRLEARLIDGTWQAIVTQPITVERHFIPIWLGKRDLAELMSRQMPNHMVHPPKALRAETFPSDSESSEKLKFAVITPSYRQGKFLDETIRSVLVQQGVILNYIVQDGGSDDGSVEVIRRYVSQLSDWETCTDKGQADAIATGMIKILPNLKADDLMAWINSDDFYMPGALGYVADYFAKHPDVDVIYGHRVLVDENSQEIGRWFLPPHDDEVLKLNDFVPQETMFWRRRIWDKVGGIDTSFKFAMDWDLLLRFQAAGAKIVRVPYFLACFRIHSAQKTSAQMESVGQKEIDALRLRTFGRVIPPHEIENHPRLIKYLRKSAWIEFLWRRFRIRHR